MGNVANQLVAVAATLLGFVAHDVLSERNGGATAPASVSVAAAVDTVVTRGIPLEVMPVEEWLTVSPRTSHDVLRAPVARIPGGTAAARPARQGKRSLAGVRVNELSDAPPAGDAEMTFLR